jgi:hypothetical protein
MFARVAARPEAQRKEEPALPTSVAPLAGDPRVLRSVALLVNVQRPARQLENDGYQSTPIGWPDMNLREQSSQMAEKGRNYTE